MGLIGRALTSGAIASVGEAAEDLSEVFVANATREMELSQEAYAMALEAAMEEYRHAGTAPSSTASSTGSTACRARSWRLARSACSSSPWSIPQAFAARMVGLAEVPEPLWWLLGAIVGFYFGARELHYRRVPRAARDRAGRRWLGLLGGREGDDENPALEDWERPAVIAP
jgi:hypothetical protein